MPSEKKRLNPIGRSRSVVMAAIIGEMHTAQSDMANPAANAKTACTGNKAEKDRAHATAGAAIEAVIRAVRSPVL